VRCAFTVPTEIFHPPGDLLVRKAVGDEPDHLGFGCGQRAGVASHE
jgi:hypothetical protein